MADFIRNEIVSVGTSSVKIMEKINFSPRQTMIIRNTSPNAADIITITFGKIKATADNGIVLRQNDAYAESNSEGFDTWNGPAQAICATVNGQLSIMER